jgi:hypothetical protein
MTNPNKFLAKEEFNDGKYQVLSMTDGESNLRRIICTTPSICLIPFDTNEDKIRNVYLARYMDYLNGEHGHTCIVLDSKGEFNSDFEEVEHACKSELRINCDVNDVYYLGKIKFSLPFTKEIKCYGINLDGHSKDLSGFTINTDQSDNKMYILDKVRFTRILNGEIDDSTCLSAALLLASYINK